MSLQLRGKPTEAPPARPRRRWLLPALVTLAWLTFGVLGSSYSGLLSEVQTNDGASFLPAGAEATEVAHLQERFAGGKIQPALVVYSRDSGRGALLAASMAAWLHQLTATPGPAGQLVGWGARNGKAMIATLRHRLIRVPACLVFQAGQPILHPPPGHHLLAEILARLRKLLTLP